MILDEDEYEDYIAHYGILRKSGRYPWGSGGNQSTRNRSFLQTIQDMRDQGLTDDEIRKGFGIKSQEWRDAKSYAKAEQKASQIAQAEALREKGMSNVAAAARMGIPESSYRSLLAEGTKERNDVLLATSRMLKDEVDSKNFVDVGAGVENYLGISSEKLRASVSALRQQGYELHKVPIKQIGTNKDTQTLVLCPPGTTQRDAFINRHKLRQIEMVSNDGGRNYLDTKKFPIVSIHPDRVHVNYKEDGGDQADGVIYVRKGVPDVSLGRAKYAQVRIQVGDGHYLKGMAMYRDDLPKGADLVFNTNKSKKDAATKLDVMKPLERTPDGKVDPDLPFGAVTTPLSERTGRPLLRTSKEGEDRVVSAMNIVTTEGKWHDWNRNISAQALSKQPPSLAREQLKKTYEARKSEYDEIMSLTNPAVKKKLLETFADSTDASAVHLKAAAMERQNWRVILPFKSVKPTEIYAPGYRDGERVVLIRYPHGGTFEIPELTVNNRNREGKSVLGEVKDAVGIHHTVAERLSGADFDGDTVLVIPNNSGKINSTPPLAGLKGFDPKTRYKNPPGVEFKGNKQQLMGDVSNLITDMTIKGAPHSDIVRAVRHSMVVIDAEKHNLNWQESARREGIADLKRQYQNSARGGASTLISRAGSPKWVNDRELRKASDGGPIDPVTGKKVYVETGRLNAKGQPKKIKSKKLAEEDDAFNLVSDRNAPTTVERYYAEHSNRLKALANQARRDLVNTPRPHHDKSAAKVYHDEVKTLTSKLALAERNAPLERQAQVIAGAIIKAKVDANPNLKGDKDQLKKIRYQALEDARVRMGANKPPIVIEQREWDAIQAGALPASVLDRIVRHADLERLRELATPRPERMMTQAKTARAMRMLKNGASRADVARQLGVSVSTLDAATMGDDQDDDE